jgi:hypothetical protein
MTSDALIEVIEGKLEDYGLKKAMPDDELLAEAYRGFHRSQQLREKFREVQRKFDKNAAKIEVPSDLKEQVCEVLGEHTDLRWDDAIQIVLDKGSVDRVRTEKQTAKEKSGDFTDADEDHLDSDSDDTD